MGFHVVYDVEEVKLGFAVGKDRSMEAFRQSCLQCVGGELSLTYPSFHGWFTGSLTAFLREASM